MEKTEFDRILSEQRDTISRIRELAHGIHDGVNQKYDKTHPYWYHLDMVADLVKGHASEACECSEDVVPLVFGAYFHDSIEDARLTYNDVRAIARGFFEEEKAIMATEIAYALTNEKGRSRAERANEKYYSGIRSTPYAPLVKLADRVANFTYSKRGSDSTNFKMEKVYEKEMEHFLKSITVENPTDKRFILPQSLLEKIFA